MSRSSTSRPVRARDAEHRPHSPDIGSPRGGSRTISLPVIITHSRVSALAACPRRHWWAYELGIRRDQSSLPLSIGSAFHAAVERVRRGDTLEAAVETARAGLADPADAELTACMVAGWEWRWRDAPLGKCLATETTWQLRVGRGRGAFVAAGKIDAIYELADGRVAVVENKTTREDIGPVSDYWRRLNIDRQISWYILGARELGYPATTVIYDVARVPGLRPRLLSRKKDSDGARESVEQYAERVMADIAARPDWYYARHEIPRLDSDLAAAREEMAQWFRVLRGFQRDGQWPRNADACMRWGRCPYFGPCADGFDPMTQGVPSGYRVVADVHAELAQESPSDNIYNDNTDQASASNR
jgi:hypothetical protein